MATDPDEYELLLDRAVRAVREVAVPNGPPADVVEKVRLASTTTAARQVDSIDRAQSAPETFSSPIVLVRTFGVKLMRPRNLAAIAVAGLLIVLGTQLLPIQPSGNFAFAEVLEQVRKTKSAQYTEMSTLPMPDGKPGPTLVGHVKIIGDRLKRTELDVQLNHGENDHRDFLGPWGHSVEIIDLNQKKKATLYPEVKGYMIMPWRGTFAGAYVLPPEEVKKQSKEAGVNTKTTNTFVAGEFNWDLAKPDPQMDIYELIRHVPPDRAKKLEEKIMNGKRAVGFLVEQDEKPANITTKWRHSWWVDPATKLPMQLEISWRSDAKGFGGEKVISDIVFDAPVDPVLFSIDLPAGYTDLGPAAKKAEEDGKAMAKNRNRMMTMQFTEVENMKSKDGRRAPELVKRVMILDMHLKREEVTIQSADKSAMPPPPGIVSHISIQDAKQGKTIVLLPEKKEFLDPAKIPFTDDYVQWHEKHKQQSKRSGKSNVYAALNFPDKQATRLPLKSIDGQLAFGKYVEQKVQRNKYLDSSEWTFWLDPFTMQIMRGEVTLRSTDPSIDDVDYMLRAFSLYAPVDKAMFSIDPPPGWTDLSKKRAVNDEPSAAPGKSDE